MLLYVRPNLEAVTTHPESVPRFRAYSSPLLAAKMRKTQPVTPQALPLSSLHISYQTPPKPVSSKKPASFSKPPRCAILPPNPPPLRKPYLAQDTHRVRSLFQNTGLVWDSHHSRNLLQTTTSLNRTAPSILSIHFTLDTSRRGTVGRDGRRRRRDKWGRGSILVLPKRFGPISTVRTSHPKNTVLPRCMRIWNLCTRLLMDPVSVMTIASVLFALLNTTTIFGTSLGRRGAAPRYRVCQYRNQYCPRDFQ